MIARGGHPGPTDGLIFQRGLSFAGGRIAGFLASSLRAAKLAALLHVVNEAEWRIRTAGRSR